MSVSFTLLKVLLNLLVCLFSSNDGSVIVNTDIHLVKTYTILLVMGFY